MTPFGTMSTDISYHMVISMLVSPMNSEILEWRYFIIFPSVSPEPPVVPKTEYSRRSVNVYWWRKHKMLSCKSKQKKKREEGKQIFEK